MSRRKVVILGAAGRDFHNFCSPSARRPATRWSRSRPPRSRTSRAGSIRRARRPALPAGDPHLRRERARAPDPRQDIEEVGLLLQRHGSSGRHAPGLPRPAAGASFRLLGPRSPCSPRAVRAHAVCAVRTGVGKTQTTRRVAGILNAWARGGRDASPDAVRRPRGAGRASASAATRIWRSTPAPSRRSRSTSRTSSPVTWSTRAWTTSASCARPRAKPTWSCGTAETTIRRATTRSPHRAGRSASGRRRGPLLPGRDQLLRLRRDHRDQGRHRGPRQGRPGAWPTARATTPAPS